MREHKMEMDVRSHRLPLLSQTTVDMKPVMDGARARARVCRGWDREWLNSNLWGTRGDLLEKIHVWGQLCQLWGEGTSRVTARPCHGPVGFLSCQCLTIRHPTQRKRGGEVNAGCTQLSSTSRRASLFKFKDFLTRRPGDKMPRSNHSAREGGGQAMGSF